MSPGVSTRSRGSATTRVRSRQRAWPTAVRTVLADAAAGLRRNSLMVAAATTIMAIALTVAGGGLLASSNLANIAAILEAQVEIVGFFRRDLPPAEQRRARAQAEALDGVGGAAIVSRAEALRRLQQTYRSMASTGGALPSNPLPDSIEVRATDPRRIREVAEALRRIPGIEDVTYGAPVVERLVALTRAVRIAGALVAALLVAGALLIIVNTIRLTITARRQEIEIMTLVGASPGFVRGPFLVEGLLQGAAAALTATALLAAGYLGLASRVASGLPFLPMLPPAAVLPSAVALVWLLGMTVGLGGSEIGIRRYLVA
jgi:cell division transport system permease protein